MRDAARKSIAKEWRRHMKRPFPPRLRGEEIDGVDMVMVDADIAGCVVTWLTGSGCLDDWRLSVLRACAADLDRVIPTLSNESEAAYYGGLRDMAGAVLAAQ